MKACTYRLSLDELIARPKGLLVLIGAEDDNPGDQGGEGGDETGGESDDKGDKSKSKDDKSGEDEDDKSGEDGAEPTDADKKISALEEEKDRHYNLRKKAEKELADAKKEIKKLQTANASDESKTQIDELEKKTVKQDATISRLSLENAFLKANTHNWVDPEAALALADLSQVEVDDDGKAHGLASALDKLAKSKPYLIKAAEDSKPKPKPRQKTGDAPGGKPGSQASEDAKRAKLRDKYSGLRR
jgi:hypothetical protein